MSEISKVQFDPRVVISFTVAELDVLMKCSAAHYDLTCREMSAVGGTIYGLRNRTLAFVEVRDQHGDCSAGLSNDAVESWPLSFHEVDLMAKCCEIFVAGTEYARVQTGLYRTFKAAMKRMGEESERVNGGALREAGK
jgi:hypothetical protein